MLPKSSSLYNSRFFYSSKSFLSKTKTLNTSAQKAKSRSIKFNRILLINRKKRKSSKRSYCIFFSRFGRCNNNDKCPYIHDPDKIAVCTRFLRGTCKIKDCPFSHKLAPEKMPVCSYFLQGRCNFDSCPYRHVKVNPKADICKHFLKGYCPKGDQCKLRHEFVCKKCKGSKICRLCNNKKQSDAKCNKTKLTNRQRAIKFRKKIKEKKIEEGKNAEDNEDESEDDQVCKNVISLQNDFIPLVSEAKSDDDEEVFQDDLNERNLHLIRPIGMFDYDSDDSWEELDPNPSLSSKKPLIRILPKFLLDKLNSQIIS